MLDIMKDTSFDVTIQSVPFNTNTDNDEPQGPLWPDGIDLFMAIRLCKSGASGLDSITSLYLLIGWLDAGFDLNVDESDISYFNLEIEKHVLPKIFTKSFADGTGVGSLADAEYKAIAESHKFCFPNEMIECPLEMIQKYDVLLNVG